MKEESNPYYHLVRKTIKSKILSKREACDLVTLFMIAASESKNNDRDYLYSKLLDLHIKTYHHKNYRDEMKMKEFDTYLKELEELSQAYFLAERINFIGRRKCGRLNFLVGINGSGKTRLIKQLADSHEKTDFLHSQCLLLDEAIERLNEPAKKRFIQYLRSLGKQVFLTCFNKESVPVKRAEVFFV